MDSNTELQSVAVSRYPDVNHDRWLDRWLPDVERYAGSSSLLELGCGEGRDTRVLINIGTVVAADLSWDALVKCKRNAPGVLPVALDISGPLPFGNESFHVIVASLCMHYFTWSTTFRIRDEIRRCLAPGGLLLVRLNSSNDVHFGASGYPELETGLYNVKGRSKRFFSKDDISKLFSDSAWLVKNMEEKTVARYEKPKTLWEAVLEKG